MKVMDKIYNAILYGNNFSLSASNERMGLKGKRYEVIVGETIQVKIWGHLVAEASGTLVINNCGYFTKITKEALNTVMCAFADKYGLPHKYISQKNRKWYIDDLEWDGSEAMVM